MIKNILAIIGALAVLSGSVAAFHEFKSLPTVQQGKPLRIFKTYAAGTVVDFTLTGMANESYTVPAGWKLQLDGEINSNLLPE